MKFAAVVVLFALALGAQCSVVPLITSSVHGPILIAGPHGPPAAVAVHASPLQIIGHPLPLISQVVGPAVSPVVVAVAPAEATYVAKTRGAVHVAPLPGHSESAASVNLEPAPGTH